MTSITPDQLHKLLSEMKNRGMYQICLNTGTKVLVNSNIATNIPAYIRAINGLNQHAHVYGIVYAPFDKDYDTFVEQSESKQHF